MFIDPSVLCVSNVCPFALLAVYKIRVDKGPSQNYFQKQLF